MNGSFATARRRGGGTGPGGGGLLLVVLAAALSVPGCCSTAAPPAERFFDRATVDGALRGFVYAIDTYQWDYAYSSLTESSREEVGRLKFEVVVRFLEEPRTDIPFYDLISSAIEIRSRPRYDATGQRARVKVVARGRDPSGTVVFIPVYIYLQRELAEWRLDLLQSLGTEPSAPPPRELSRR